MQRWREGCFFFPPSPSPPPALSPPPLLLSFCLSISKLFNKLSAENIRLPTHRCNLAFDLGMSPSCRQEEFLPYDRSEISKMPSVELNHWALGDDSQGAKSGIFCLTLSPLWDKKGFREEETPTLGSPQLPAPCPSGLPWSHGPAVPLPWSESHLHFLVLVVIWLTLIILSEDKGSAK